MPVSQDGLHMTHVWEGGPEGSGFPKRDLRENLS